MAKGLAGVDHVGPTRPQENRLQRQTRRLHLGQDAAHRCYNLHRHRPTGKRHLLLEIATTSQSPARAPLLAVLSNEPPLNVQMQDTYSRLLNDLKCQLDSPCFSAIAIDVSNSECSRIVVTPTANEIELSLLQLLQEVASCLFLIFNF